LARTSSASDARGQASTGEFFAGTGREVLSGRSQFSSAGTEGWSTSSSQLPQRAGHPGAGNATPTRKLLPNQLEEGK